MRTRQPAPPFRRGRVVEVADVSPTLRRVVIEGDELRAMDVAGPGAGVRLLLPPTPDRPVDLPVWNGNAYFAVDGSRPPIRTMTPLDQDQAAGRLAFEVVRHDGGLLTPWVDAVERRRRGRRLRARAGATSSTRTRRRSPMLGDQSALPAIRQLVARHAGRMSTVSVVVEVPDDASETVIGDHPTGSTVRWTHARPWRAAGRHALVDAVSGLELSDTSRLWAAGEAAADATDPPSSVRRSGAAPLGRPRPRLLEARPLRGPRRLE